MGSSRYIKGREAIKETLLTQDMEVDIRKIQPELEKIKSQSYQSFKMPIEDVIAIQNALKKVKKLQENIIYCLFVMDLSQTKLAKILGISSQKAEQIKKEAVHTLQV